MAATNENGMPCAYVLSARPVAKSQNGNMKTKLVILCFLLIAFCLPAIAQYSINWYAFTGGGGTSTGGVYTVTATVGQYCAGGPMSGGNYSLTGGFWSLYAVQTPGAPSLRIFLTATNTAVVAWPYPSTGFTLQSNTNLSTANWSSAGGTTNVVGSEYQLIVSPPVGNQFYRLKQ
jgi:hypothetical protein